jgi:hypothetical protein
MQLQVHLEHDQCVTFDENDPDAVSQLTTEPDDTHLTAFFKENQRNELARNILYIDFPRFFRWNRNNHRWTTRKGGDTIGRLVFIPPNAGDKFYARLMLSTVRNLQSFEDMRTYQSIVYPTIREACIARGLLDDDGEWRRTIEEGMLLQSGTVLRSLFIMIVSDCTPADPMKLWDLYKEHLCDDLGHRLSRQGVPHLTREVIHDYGLHLIEQYAAVHNNRTMTDLGLRAPQQNWNAVLQNRYILQHLQYDTEEEQRQFEEAMEMMNTDQDRAVRVVMECVLSRKGTIFFVQGAAGAGKTLVCEAMSHGVRARNGKALCIASSGIASLLLPGGRTAHSCLKIPVEIAENSTCAIRKNSPLAAFLREIDLLIWDECSMQHRYAFEAIDRTLQDVRESNVPFGNLCVVLGGDFLQTLPVVKWGTKADTIHASLLRSTMWPYIEKNMLKLEKNMRVSDDADEQSFASWLRDLARGTLNDDNNNITLPQEFCCPLNSVNALIQEIYERIAEPQSAEYFQQRCILCPRNREVHDINASVLDIFPGDCHEMWSVDRASDGDTSEHSQLSYPPEVLHAASPSGFPLAQLKLKIGCPVIVLHNLQPDDGVCNGSRGIVTRISRRVLEVQLFTEKIVLLPRVKLICSDPEFPFVLHRLQFPVALAFAMTINKSQGQSFRSVGVDLRLPVFAHGQLYVALSRAKSKHGLRCILNPTETEGQTKNVVYRDVVI